jgi:hypothetical protein
MANRAGREPGAVIGKRCKRVSEPEARSTTSAAKNAFAD